MFRIKKCYGSGYVDDCVLNVAGYANNGHIALSIVSLSEGPYAPITVNIDGIEAFGKNCSCVDTNNFPEVVDVIKDLGIGEPVGVNLKSGFCSYPVYKFDIDKINVV